MQYNHFKNGQKRLANGDCDGARSDKKRIVELMTVPLVQGTLRSAHMIANTDGELKEKHSAEGAAFALSILPILHSCSEEDASSVYNQMQPGNLDSVDFQTVKSAFERNYECMNILCRHVGGIYDESTGRYIKGAEPCFSYRKKRASVAILVMGIAFVCVAVAAFAIFFVRKYTCKIERRNINVKDSLPTVPTPAVPSPHDLT